MSSNPLRPPVRLPRALGPLLALPLLLLACGAPEAGSGPPGGGPEPVAVQVVTVLPTRLPRTIASVGSLESPDMVTISSEVEGTVASLDVPEGRFVEKGHVLVRIDDAEPRAALRRVEARLTNARERLRRLERLRKESVSSEQAYDDALAERDVALAEYDELRSRLRKTRIVTPFAGVAGLRQVDLGEYVEAGTAIVELTRVDPLELVFDVPQRFVSELAVGQRIVGVAGRCGPEFEGTVQVIDPRVNPTTRSMRLQANIQNPAGALHPGMAVSLRVVVGEIDDALVVPQEAIVRQGTRHLVYVLDADDRAEQRTVGLGQFVGGAVHVQTGIEPGARVVTAGQQKLRPGAPTQPAPFEPTDNPNLALGSDAAACPEIIEEGSRERAASSQPSAGA